MAVPRIYGANQTESLGLKLPWVQLETDLELAIVGRELMGLWTSQVNYCTVYSVVYSVQCTADMENVNMCTQASFLNIKFYPKARKLRQMLIATKQQKLCNI